MRCFLRFGEGCEFGGHYSDSPGQAPHLESLNPILPATSLCLYKGTHRLQVLEREHPGGRYSEDHTLYQQIHTRLHHQTRLEARVAANSNDHVARRKIPLAEVHAKARHQGACAVMTPQACCVCDPHVCAALTQRVCCVNPHVCCMTPCVCNVTPRVCCVTHVYTMR